MSLIVGMGIGKSFGSTYVIQSARFNVVAGERIGLVGPNGEGKTTLLRILAGMDTPTVGKLERKHGLRIGYLPQDPPALDDKTLWESMLDVFADLRAMETEMGEISGRLHDDPDGELLRHYGELQNAFESGGGYDCEQRIKTVLTGLGFAPEDHHKPLAHLSGGQRTRALLGRLLLEQPEVLLLDEPTNHLDLDAVEWLERYLAGFRQALVVVSHDRYFLNNVTEWTWEIAFGNLDVYRGNYTAYVTKRDERYKERMREWEGQREFIEKTEEFIRRFIAGQRSKEAQGRRTRLERFMATEAVAKPQRHQEVKVRIAPLIRTGELVLRVSDLVVGYQADKPLVQVGDLEVHRGDRVALVGPNGVGKTTLLRTLLGQLKPLRGEYQLGVGVNTGYLPQSHDNLDPGSTVLQAVLDVDVHLTAERARTLLGSLLFRGEEVFKKISQISGGQRSRVIFARLAVLAPNTLLLDEPTNHLDLPSREVIQDMLKEFPGTVIFVSHDRYLVQSLATHIWAMEDGAIHRIAGGWEDYVRWRAEYRAGAHEASPVAVKQQAQRRQGSLDARKRTKDRQRMERQLADLEQAIEPLEARLRELMEAVGEAGVAGDLDRVRKLGEEYEQVNGQLKAKWDEYEALHEQLDQLPD
jgi:ATP-binding cassette subfamily F protein 3